MRLDALKAARAAGVRVRIDGDDLVLEAPRATAGRGARSPFSSQGRDLGAAPPGQRRLVGRGLAGLLRRAGRHRRVRWRVAAGRGRGTRLRLLRDRMAEPQSRASLPGRCLGCGGGEQPDDPLLPFGTETQRPCLAASRCWPAWCQAREAEAIAALTSMGIRASA